MDLYLIEKNTKKRRKAEYYNCEYCKKEFLRRIKKKRKKRYCCYDCYYKFVKSKRIELRCANCDKIIKKSASKLKNSKHKKYFCDRKCKDIAQRLGGVKEIQPSHYKDGEYVYRKNALAFYVNECACCRYDEYLEILEVHHIDRNRKNNNLDNLIILCPNCHRKITKKLFILEILGNGTARRGHLVCNQNFR